MKPSAQVTKFGDGYEARVATGINSKPAIWNVTFTKPTAEAIEILDFVEARNAVEAFDWVDPIDRSGVYVCREWSSSQIPFGLIAVVATFEQVFEY
jgi:phage-related protein